ncbi:FecR family protein [Leptothoe sp. PORK10 BA2]|uniref:FecR family protein n=1 Tax=Leptothoe sp. PORK10 BA2 TaxID=3110254 RepID=UPI002B20CFF7|nr:FecR family protein [Leptothoe sp. PORK10 BA2]MEA5463056.1 FecR family protein [Leptothoe sp. PORK10 BA2]
MQKVSAIWCSLLLGTALILGNPVKASAQTTLTSAKVESLRNRVHLIPTGSNARLARVADVMRIGDALRTAASARAELRFNDGSLARVGEQATFRFTPNTRNFQLSNGTVLLLIPPGRGRTTIQTPNAVTGIQGSALFVRVQCLAELTSEGHCASPVTFVGALTNNPAGAMVAYNESGSQQQLLYAGEMVVIEDGNISQRLEFDLSTFYQTAGLAEGLGLDSATPPAELSEDLQEVWQEIQDALELQGDFDSQGSAEEIVENPDFIAPVATAINLDSAELDTASNGVFAGFPGFESSPAASFHGLGEVATSSEAGSTTGVISTPSSVVTTSTPTTSVAVQPVTPQITDDTVVQQPVTPIATVPETTIPGESVAVTPTTTPVTAVPPTPVVTIVPEQPPIIPEADQTPVREAVPEDTFNWQSAEPNVAPAPEVTTVPEVTVVPEQQPIIPEAEQTPVRETVSEDAFDWRSAGTNDPEVLQVPDLPTQTEQGTETNLQL